jgi:hypothetical protein
MSKREREQQFHQTEALRKLGLSFDDIDTLRRCSRTLQRWFELECGDSDTHGSWCIVRGTKRKAPAEWAIKLKGASAWWDGGMWTANTPEHPLKLYTSTEKAAVEGFGVPDHVLENAEWIDCAGGGRVFEHDGDGTPFTERQTHHGGGKTTYTPIPDREKGARKRIAKILAKPPTLQSYVQTDPRGCALHVLRPGDVPPGEDVSSYYTRGIAVY